MTIQDVVYLDFSPDFVSVSQHGHEGYHGFIRKGLADELALALDMILNIGDYPDPVRIEQIATEALARYIAASEKGA